MSSLHVILISSDDTYAKSIENILHVIPEVNFLGYRNPSESKELKKINIISNCLLIDTVTYTNHNFIRQADAQHKILIDEFGGKANEKYKKMLRYSANSYVSQRSDFLSICKALDCVKTGNKYFDGDISEMLFDLDSILLKELSDREFDVLYELMLAKSVKQIANELGIMESTVKTHLDSVYSKFGTSNRYETVDLIHGKLNKG